MYSDWASLLPEIQSDPGDQGVLARFSYGTSREVVSGIVRNLLANMNRCREGLEGEVLLTDGHVAWTMEILCFGLTLPPNDWEVTSVCVSIYCEWLSCLSEPKRGIPGPMVEEPNEHFRRMLGHLVHLFKPRPDAGVESMSRHVSMCTNVVRTVQAVVSGSTVITPETWVATLKFLLTVCDSLLGPPTVKDDVGSQMCERMLSALFETWLVACGSGNFPSPSLWKTLHETCLGWRHHEALVVQWHRINSFLTSRLLTMFHGPEGMAQGGGGGLPLQLQSAEEDGPLQNFRASNDVSVQCWFRFLHLLGNPVDLSRPRVISSTQRFLHAALSSRDVVEPHQHDCLAALPSVFYRAMKCVSVVAAAFLGSDQKSYVEMDSLASGAAPGQPVEPPSVTPPPARKPQRASFFPLIKTKEASSRMSLSENWQQPPSLPPSSSGQPAAPSAPVPPVPSLGPHQPQHPQQRPSDSFSFLRPKVNSLLHLLGAWLFDASLVGADVIGPQRVVGVPTTTTTTTTTLAATAAAAQSMTLNPSHQQQQQQQQQQYQSRPTLFLSGLASPSQDDWDNNEGPLHGARYEAGRAQACGTLCRIFCSVRTEEQILGVYVARFYTVLYYGLKVDLESSSHPVLINIILNSSDIFKVNLVGSQVLVPHYLRAVEFLQTIFKYNKHDNVDEDADQRFASIQLLLSMVCLPLHFGQLEIRNILDDQRHQRPTCTFASLLPTVAGLLVKILSKEIEPINVQMLLGGIALLVADMAVREERSESRTTKGSTSSDLLEVYDRSVSLVCQRLISSWTPELGSSLAAMELLQFFSTLEALKGGRRRPRVSSEGGGAEPEDESFSAPALPCPEFPSVLETNSRRIVVTMCDFVVLQCNKQAKYHSKDLHSSIVSAYQCLMTCLVEHDYLLRDAAVLHTVLQVTELGISGSRSQPRQSDPPVFKGDKELKPISLRVKDAAEALLATIVDHVGSFPTPSGPESLCTLLDEESFLSRYRQSSDGRGPEFQYFAVDGSVILGLFEPPSEAADVPPTLVAITRSLFGRHAWLLKLCHESRTKGSLQTQHSSTTTTNATANDAPLEDPTQQQQNNNTSNSGTASTSSSNNNCSSSNTGILQNVQSEIQPHYFPDSLGQVPKVLADQSIPPIEKTMASYEEQLESLRRIIERQKAFEEESISERLRNYRPPSPCRPPSSTKISNAARLFLSHFGFLTLDNLRGGSMTSSAFPALIRLKGIGDSDPDDRQHPLGSDLRALDGLSTRTADIVHVYYVRPGQNRIEDVLANVLSEKTVSADFMEFLLSLGWPVEVENHPGWTGNPATSWKVKDTRISTSVDEDGRTGGSCYDGTRRILYWADVSTELVFLVPSRDSVVRSDAPTTEPGKTARQTSVPEGGTSSASSTSESDQGGDGGPKMRRSGRVGGQGPTGEIQVVVVWLEHFEDHVAFPIDDLPKLSNHQQAAESKLQRPMLLAPGNFCLLFVHPLHTGLFRVHVQAPPSRAGDAGPLVDGAVVSRRVLGRMVRQTAYNVYKRKTLESDAHQPPHVRRRIAIKEIIQRHQCSMSESDFCASLFRC